MQISKAKLLAQAAKRIDAMDEIDRQHGNATPQQGGMACVMNTVRVACDAALSHFEHGDEKTAIECVADCVVMASRILGIKEAAR